MRITDYGTLRVQRRLGVRLLHALWFRRCRDRPGRRDTQRAVIASGTDPMGVKPPYSLDQTNAETKTGDFAYGYTAGFGMDYAVFQNFFVRGEYEYVQFGQFQRSEDAHPYGTRGRGPEVSDLADNPNKARTLHARP